MLTTKAEPPPVPALPLAIVLAICGVVGAGYAFACSNAARLAYFRRTRARAPSTPIDRELAERVVRRHGATAALLAVGCIVGVLAIISVPMGVASRVAMMVTPTFVAMVALATAIRLFWTASALAVRTASIQYDGAYYLFIVRGGRMRGWIGALPRSLQRAAATTLPKAVVAQL